MADKVEVTLSDMHDIVCELREVVRNNGERTYEDTPELEDIVIMPDDDCNDKQMKKIRKAYEAVDAAIRTFDCAFHDLFDCR
jgi:hypothetical protein